MAYVSIANTKYRTTSHPATMVSLPPIPFLPKQKCPICHEHVPRPSLDLTTLPCGHSFHPECICPWIQHSKQHDCPLCRAPAVHTCGHPLGVGHFKPSARISALYLDEPCTRDCPALSGPHFHSEEIYGWLNERRTVPPAIAEWLNNDGPMPREIWPFANRLLVCGQPALLPPQVPSLAWFRGSVLQPVGRTPTGELRPSIVLQRRQTHLQKELLDVLQRREDMTQAIRMVIPPQKHAAWRSHQNYLFAVSEIELERQIDVCQGVEGAQDNLLRLANSDLHKEYTRSVKMRDRLTAALRRIKIETGRAQSEHERHRRETLVLLMHALRLYNDPHVQPQHKRDLSRQMSLESGMRIRRGELIDRLDAAYEKLDHLRCDIVLHSYCVGTKLGTSFSHLPDVDERALRTLDLMAEAVEWGAQGRKLRLRISNSMYAAEIPEMLADMDQHPDEAGDYIFTTQMIEDAIERLAPGGDEQQEEQTLVEGWPTMEDQEFDQSDSSDWPDWSEDDQYSLYDFEDPMPGNTVDEDPSSGPPFYVLEDDAEDDGYFVASEEYSTTQDVRGVTG